MATKKPLVLDSTNQQVTQLVDGDTVPVSSIPVDNAAGNLLKATDTGLTVSLADAVSEQAGNQLKVQDGKLYVEEPVYPVAQDYISSDADNALTSGSDGGLFVKPVQVVSASEGNFVRPGTDGGAYLDGNDLLSNGGLNLLTIDPTDKKLILTEEVVKNNISILSKDEGNLLTEGSDGGVLLTIDELVSDEDNVLVLDDGKLATELGLSYNTTTGELTLTGASGTEVGSVVVPTSTSVCAMVSEAADNQLACENGKLCVKYISDYGTM